MTGFFVPLSIVTLCIFAGHVGAGVWVCLIPRRLRADRHAHPQSAMRSSCWVVFLTSCFTVQFFASLAENDFRGSEMGLRVCVWVGMGTYVAWRYFLVAWFS